MDKQKRRPTFPSITLQIFCLLAMAGTAGIAVNCLRSAPLPLIQDWSPQARQTVEGEEIYLNMDQAIAHFKNRDATFIDARSSRHFNAGHIQGALNLPWHQAEEQLMTIAPLIDPDVLVITYCDGETCNLSHNLADFLREMGFRVKVMTGGWEAWCNAGMPVDSGKQEKKNG